MQHKCPLSWHKPLGFLGFSPKAPAIPLEWNGMAIFALSSFLREEDNNNPRVAKREAGAQGTNKCEGMNTVWVSQIAYTEPGKAGTGQCSCHPGAPGEGLCPGPRHGEQGGE